MEVMPGGRCRGCARTSGTDGGGRSDLPGWPRAGLQNLRHLLHTQIYLHDSKAPPGLPRATKPEQCLRGDTATGSSSLPFVTRLSYSGAWTIFLPSPTPDFTRPLCTAGNFLLSGITSASAPSPCSACAPLLAPFSQVNHSSPLGAQFQSHP